MYEHTTFRELTDIERRSTLAGFAAYVLRRDEFMCPSKDLPTFKEPTHWNTRPNRETVALQIMTSLATSWRHDWPLLDEHGGLPLLHKQFRTPQVPFIAVPQYEFVRQPRAEEETAQYLRAELFIANTGLTLRQRDIDLGIAVSVATACGEPGIPPRTASERLVRRVSGRYAPVPSDATAESFHRYAAPLELTGGAYQCFVDFGMDLRTIANVLRG